MQHALRFKSAAFFGVRQCSMHLGSAVQHSLGLGSIACIEIQQCSMHCGKAVQHALRFSSAARLEVRQCSMCYLCKACSYVCQSATEQPATEATSKNCSSTALQQFNV